jgi:hypothetical protein
LSDDELRRLLRARSVAPGDVDVARRAAALAARTGDRDLAAASWQDVLRASPRDREASKRLVALGCELLYKHSMGDDEVFESVVDHGLLVRPGVLPGCWVSARPVTYIQFQLFLDGAGEGLEERIAPWQRRLVELKPESPVTEVSWLGARAYALWAGGRLLGPDELRRVARASAAFDWDVSKEEWVEGERLGAGGVREHPVARVRGAGPGVQWHGEAVFAPVTFRYARSSWFRLDAKGAPPL